MTDTGIRSNIAQASPRHRIAEVHNELTRDLADRVSGRDVRPRLTGQLYRQRARRSTHTLSVEGHQLTPAFRP